MESSSLQLNLTLENGMCLVLYLVPALPYRTLLWVSQGFFCILISIERGMGKSKTTQNKPTTANQQQTQHTPILLTMADSI